NVFEVYNESGLTFFTVPFISGMSLRTYLKEDPQPPFSKVLRYLSQSADALAYAHKRGVVHRDVKPDNILIDVERDRVILTDFGIAKALAAETTLTTPGDLLGTPQYMSPEQGEGRQDLDGRADQYSLGLIGWEMLAGQRPFQADNLAELMYKHRFEEPEDIDEIRPDAPYNMRLAIKRAISKERELRFSTMEEFRSAIEAPDGVIIDQPPARRGGAQEATVRIPTPPSMRRKPPIERTAPESTQPSAAGGGADTTEPWTPPSGKMPWEEPSVDARAPDESETVLLGSLAERPSGPHKGLLVGGGIAVVVAVALLFLAGPFKASRQAEMSQEIVPEAGVTTPAEGAGDEVAAADDQPGVISGDAAVASIDPQAGQPAAGEPADQGRTPPEPAAEQPPAAEREDVGTPGAVQARQAELAQTARNAVIDRRNAAIAAGAAASFQPLLDSLDAALRAADRKMSDQNYGPALADFSGLILGYAALTESARSAASAASVTSAARSAADQARQAALAQQAAVLSAGGETFLPGELRTLNQRLAAAQSAFDEGRFEPARDAFRGLAGDYEALLSQVKTAGAAAADAAQGEMHERRLAARQAGADDAAPQQMAAADNTRNRAFNAEQQERYADAVGFYNQARDEYAEIVTNLAARPSPVSAEDQLAAVIEQFRALLEQEDLDGIASEVYGGSIPDDDADLVNYIFRQAEEISATSTIESIEVDGTSATADAQFDLEIRNARTDQRNELQLKLRFNFDFTPEGWRVRRMRRR
ncbi:MAG TPA: protein kinase, partial [Gemmatimonadota bacterium]|nr:protein kinase [Gemmatimonadota bacterium]